MEDREELAEMLEVAAERGREWDLSRLSLEELRDLHEITLLYGGADGGDGEFPMERLTEDERRRVERYHRKACGDAVEGGHGPGGERGTP